MKIVIVCFANTCRSPVAEALLRRELRDDSVELLSRGLAGGVGTVPEPLAEVLDRAGLTITPDTGSVLQRDDARSADLLLFLERRLLRDAVVSDPTIWPRSFTWREFARRGFNDPPERTHESFEAWRAMLHAGRNREEMLGEDERDDVSDPGLDGNAAQFERMLERLTSDARKIAPLLSGWTSTSE